MELKGNFMNSAAQNISQAQIFDAVKQLPVNELEDFVDQVLIFRAKKRANSLSGAETKLLKSIYRKFSAEKSARLRHLREQLQKVDLSAGDYEELASLSDSLEVFHARRMKNLVELAKMRGLDLEAVMKQLGVKFPDYDRI